MDVVESLLELPFLRSVPGSGAGAGPDLRVVIAVLPAVVGLVRDGRVAAVEAGCLAGAIADVAVE